MEGGFESNEGFSFLFISSTANIDESFTICPSRHLQTTVLQHTAEHYFVSPNANIDN